MATPKKKKKLVLQKHPKDMTTDEAIKHIFHPEIVKHLKHHAKTHGQKPTGKE